MNTFIWTLGRWYWWTYLQGSSGDADIENRHMDMGRGKECEGGTNEDRGMETYTLLVGNCSMTQETQTRVCDNLEGWDELGGGREASEGGGICVPMADSCWCVVETNAI